MIVLTVSEMLLAMECNMHLRLQTIIKCVGFFSMNNNKKKLL